MASTATTNHTASTSTTDVLKSKIIAVSTKMYFTLTQTTSYVSSLVEVPLPENLSLIFFPTFLSLGSVSSSLSESKSSILLGAQDCASSDHGAFTGSVSPTDLADLGVKVVIAGHAERRRMYGETDEVVTNKAKAIIRNNMIPLVCIGETAHVGTASVAVDNALKQITPQVMSVLDAVPEEATIIFGYEPVWAIGAQEPASAEHVIAVVNEIKKLFADRKGETRILYGGSAQPGVWEGLKNDVDGLFLGRFSHNLPNLKKTIEEVTTL